MKKISRLRLVITNNRKDECALIYVVVAIFGFNGEEVD